MLDNWFTHPDAYEAALAPALGRAVPERDLIRSAVRALVLGLHLGDGAATAVAHAGVTTGELADALDAVVRELGPEPPALAVMTAAMAYVARLYPEVGHLRASAQLDQVVGMAVVRVLSESLYPLTGQTPDPDADARWAATELITFRQLQPKTLGALGPEARARLAERLDAHRPLLAALVPPRGAGELDTVLDKAAALLRREPPVGLDELNAALAVPGRAL